MGESYESQRAAAVRFRAYVIIHIILCTFVFFYSLSLTESLISSDDLFPLLYIFFPIIILINIVLCAFHFIVTLWLAGILVALLLLITVKDDSRVTEYEVSDTWEATLWGVIVTIVVHILFRGFRGLSILVVLFLPVLILELAVYLITLKHTARLTRARDRALDAAIEAGQVIEVEQVMETEQIIEARQVMESEQSESPQE